jgi:hypothetical protein
MKRMLFIEAGSTKRIDPQSIGAKMPGDGGSCHLRAGHHQTPVFQTCSEGFERLFREPDDSPATTSKHAGFLFSFCIVVDQHLKLAARENRSAHELARFPEFRGM